MAISKRTNTHGLLNGWQDFMLEDIWRFNQVEGSGVQTSPCGVYIQGDREQIAQALDTAWKRISRYLKFFPRPVWTEERIELGNGTPWALQHLTTRYGYIEAFGQRATSLIDDAVAVTYSDADGDNVDDTATITVATTVAADEIQIFFQTADGAPSAGHELWQIEPVTVESDGVQATITGPRALFVKPDTIWDVPFGDANKQTRNAANTGDAADFVTAVDVCRVYNDTTTPLQVIADPIFTRSTDLDGDILTTGVARLLDSRLGTFEARVEDPACFKYAQAVKVYYKAGYPLEFGKMDTTLQKAVIRLANTDLGRKLCAFCDQTDAMWTEDNFPPGNQNFATESETNNPFGPLAGQIWAWKVTMDYALVRGGKL